MGVFFLMLTSWSVWTDVETSQSEFGLYLFLGVHWHSPLQGCHFCFTVQIPIVAGLTQNNSTISLNMAIPWRYSSWLYRYQWRWDTGGATPPAPNCVGFVRSTQNNEAEERQHETASDNINRQCVMSCVLPLQNISEVILLQNVGASTLALWGHGNRVQWKSLSTSSSRGYQEFKAHF